MKRLCIALIRGYQKYLSPRKSRPTCRFYPSCSAFALEAYQKRGFFAGTLLTFFRILRCNPFCPGGYDPVPEKGITVRSYWATHTAYELSDDHDTDDTEDIEAAAPTSASPCAPTAGGKPSDHKDAAADLRDTPKRVCCKYQPENKAL